MNGRKPLVDPLERGRLDPVGLERTVDASRFPILTESLPALKLYNGTVLKALKNQVLSNL